jgi:proteasome lid subunit RPN8/RPN11
MSGRPRPLAILPDVLAEVYRHAREAFPNECCGWIAGPKDGDAAIKARRCRNAYQPEAHPTAPDRTAETAYVIAGDELLELHRELDGAMPPRVIYHSHPNGRAYLSDTDRKVATDPWGEGPMVPAQQLVVGIDAQRVVEAKLFAWDEADKAFVEVASLPGMRV